MPPVSYVNLTTLKGTGALNFTGTAYDARLLQVAEAVSQEIERYTGRIYYVLIESRRFDGPGGLTLQVPDLIAVGTLLEDTNYDGTFETGWGTADYLAWPYSAAPTASWGKPYGELRVNPKSNGTQDVFLSGVQMYRLDGTWGYRAYTEDTGETGTLATTGTTRLTVGATSTLSVGQTVLVGTEYLYVTSTGTAGTATATGAITVVRGVGGSTPATAATATISNLVFPGPITEAAMIQTSRLWKRRETGFATQMGFPETGQIVTFRGLDDDVKMLLAPYRKVVV